MSGEGVLPGAPADGAAPGRGLAVVAARGPSGHQVALMAGGQVLVRLSSAQARVVARTMTDLADFIEDGDLPEGSNDDGN